MEAASNVELKILSFQSFCILDLTLSCVFIVSSRLLCGRTPCHSAGFRAFAQNRVDRCDIPSSHSKCSLVPLGQDGVYIL